jgi:hypothetical protein
MHKKEGRPDEGRPWFQSLAGGEMTYAGSFAL